MSSTRFTHGGRIDIRDTGGYVQPATQCPTCGYYVDDLAMHRAEHCRTGPSDLPLHVDAAMQTDDLTIRDSYANREDALTREFHPDAIDRRRRRRAQHGMSCD